MDEFLQSRVTRFSAFCMFYFLPPLSKETLVNKPVTGSDRRTPPPWEHIRAILSLLAASACGKMRLVTMVKVPRRENENSGEGWV